MRFTIVAFHGRAPPKCPPLPRKVACPLLLRLYPLPPFPWSLPSRLRRTHYPPPGSLRCLARARLTTPRPLLTPALLYCRYRLVNQRECGARPHYTPACLFLRHCTSRANGPLPDDADAGLRPAAGFLTSSCTSPPSPYRAFAHIRDFGYVTKGACIIG